MYLLLDNNNVIVDVAKKIESIKNYLSVNHLDGTIIYYPNDLNLLVISTQNEYDNSVIQKYKFIDNQLVKNENYINPVSLDMLKEIKINEFSTECQNDIMIGFLSEAKDCEKLYDCEITDQTRISGLVQLAQLKLLGIIDEPIKWKAKNEPSCYEFTPAEILQLGVDLKKHIENVTDKFYSLRTQILNCSSEDELDLIKW